MRYTTDMRLALRLLAVTLVLFGAGCSRYPAAPDFTLIDQSGESWKLSQQHGKAIAMYFGFTHCPDTCPTTLAKLSKIMANDRNAEIVFVTVDPERDTPPVMNSYVKRFTGAPVIGLTGTRKQIDEVMRRYHVWAQKIPGKHGGEDYDEAHISVVFFIDPNGRQRMIADQLDSDAALASDVKNTLQ
jgi:protein SCO1